MLTGASAVREFLDLVFIERDQELMVVAFCDDRLRLVQLLSFPGSEATVQVSIPDIFRSALDYTALLIAHNHPSGDPRPSEADQALTRRLGNAAEALDVTLLDHLIFAQDRMFSFREAGLL